MPEINTHDPDSYEEALAAAINSVADVNTVNDSEKASVGNLPVDTASEINTIKTKTDQITVSQPVDLDDIETRVNSLDAAVVLKGVWDASSGTFPAGVEAGWSYFVGDPGTVDSIEFSQNDRIVALVDNADTGLYAGQWLKLDYSDQVLSVGGQTGAITLADLALDQVNNTSDADKQVSTAQQAAIDAETIRATAAEAALGIVKLNSSNAANYTIKSVTLTGQNVSPDLADSGANFYLDHTAAMTFTVPTDAPAGFCGAVFWDGAGQPTIAAAGGVHNPDGHTKLRAQYSSAAFVVKSNAGSAPVISFVGDTAS